MNIYEVETIADLYEVIFELKTKDPGFTEKHLTDLITTIQNIAEHFDKSYISTFILLYDSILKNLSRANFVQKYPNKAEKKLTFANEVLDLLPISIRLLGKRDDQDEEDEVNDEHEVIADIVLTTEQERMNALQRLVDEMRLPKQEYVEVSWPEEFILLMQYLEDKEYLFLTDDGKKHIAVNDLVKAIKLQSFRGDKVQAQKNAFKKKKFSHLNKVSGDFITVNGEAKVGVGESRDYYDEHDLIQIYKDFFMNRELCLNQQEIEDESMKVKPLSYEDILWPAEYAQAKRAIEKEWRKDPIVCENIRYFPSWLIRACIRPGTRNDNNLIASVKFKLREDGMFGKMGDQLGLTTGSETKYYSEIEMLKAIELIDTNKSLIK